MKIISINGSVGNEDTVTRIIEGIVESCKILEPALQHQVVNVADLAIQPCRRKCASFCGSAEFKCEIEDSLNVLIEDLKAADAVILGAPLFFRVPSAQFHTLVERLVAVFYYKEIFDPAKAHSPLYNKPCVLVGVSEYGNPHQVLEYLQEFCHILKMRPVMLPRFPYLGIGAKGSIETDMMFDPMERAKDMGTALWETVHPKLKLELESIFPYFIEE